MRLKNEIFAYVLDWLIQEKKVDDQKDLALKTGISQNTVSRIMTGKVEPSDDTLRKLNATFGNIFNMQYLRGESTVMLMEDVSNYKSHPDKLKKLWGFDMDDDDVDQSSLINAALAAKDEALESLKRELKTKDDLIRSLRDQIETKEQLIAEQKARIIDYKKIIDSNQEITEYPFNIGVSDRSKYERERLK